MGGLISVSPFSFVGRSWLSPDEVTGVDVAIERLHSVLTSVRDRLSDQSAGPQFGTLTYRFLVCLSYLQHIRVEHIAADQYRREIYR